MDMTPEPHQHAVAALDEWERTQGMQLDDSPTSIVDEFLSPMDAHPQFESQSRSPSPVEFVENRSLFTFIREPLFARSRAGRREEQLDVMRTAEQEEKSGSRHYWDVVLERHREDMVVDKTDCEMQDCEELSHDGEELEEEEPSNIPSSLPGNAAASIDNCHNTKPSMTTDTGSSVTSVHSSQSPEPDTHAKSNTAAADPRDSIPDYFICNLNGCEEILPREFYKVRTHIRYSELHIGGYKEMLPTAPCPFGDCGYRNESMMRVAEHVCSDRHLNAKVQCYGLKCRSRYNGRQSSLKRHRDGENGRPGSCKSCEGCESVFDSGAQRTEHEAQCAAAQIAKAERLERMKGEDKKEREEVRRRRKYSRRILEPDQKRAEKQGSLGTEA